MIRKNEIAAKNIVDSIWLVQLVEVGQYVLNTSTKSIVVVRPGEATYKKCEELLNILTTPIETELSLAE